jgi:hypothetical protein
MTGPRCRSATLIAATVAMMSSVSTLAMAQSQDAVRSIANNDSIFIDGKSFSVTPGKSKEDVAAQIKNLGAREMGPGAIVFRSGDKLYIVDVATPYEKSASYDPAIERQRPLGLRDDDYTRQQPQGLRDTDTARQQPQGLRDTDTARQQPQGLRDTETARQQPQGLRDTDGYARQAPQGLRDDYVRQQPQGYRDLTDAEMARQKGMREAEVTRQQPQGLRDTDPAVARQRAYLMDPDYVHYLLKKNFQDVWSTGNKS